MSKEKETKEKMFSFEFEVKCLTCGWQPDDPRAYQASDRNIEEARKTVLTLARFYHPDPDHQISVQPLPKK